MKYIKKCRDCGNRITIIIEGAKRINELSIIEVTCICGKVNKFRLV